RICRRGEQAPLILWILCEPTELRSWKIGNRMATGAVSRFTQRIASLAPRLSQMELRPELRSRLRRLKLLGIIILLLSPALVALAGQFVSKLGRGPSLAIGAGLLGLPAIAVGVRRGTRILKNRRETQFDRSSAHAIQRLILPQELPVCRGFGLAAVCR